MESVPHAWHQNSEHMQVVLGRESRHSGDVHPDRINSAKEGGVDSPMEMGGGVASDGKVVGKVEDVIVHFIADEGFEQNK